MSIAAFMTEYLAETSQSDLSPERLYRRVGIVLIPGETVITLCSIRSLRPNNGDGSRTLRWLLRLADKHEVILIGGASAKPGVIPDTAALVVWYQKHGFEMLGDYGIRYTGKR